MTNIPHYLRLKPQGDSDQEYLIESQTNTHVRFKETIAPNKFTKIFTDECQSKVYEETLKDITMGLFDNQDGVLFTIGPSNSGKSYTILGNESNPGISIFALNDIFNKIDNNIADYHALKEYFGESLIVSTRAGNDYSPNLKDGQYGISLSVFEIYNDRIRDLSLDLSKTANQNLDIITDSKDGKIKPSKIRQIYVSNINDAKLVLNKSTKRRAVSSTNINGKSSRSHLFIHLNIHKVIGSVIKTSRLTIADLAGSERSKVARTEGNSFREGNYTNQSLTELGRCLKMMQSPKFDSSVLRTSKLTRLLLTDLFRNSNAFNKLKIILALDPYSDLSIILHTLRYIQPVSKVPLSERSSIESNNENVQINKLIEEVASLRALNFTLNKEKEKNEENLIEFEIELRNEISQEFEEKIQELEIIHLKSVNELKEFNNNSNDEKLKLLSEEYEFKITELTESNNELTNQLNTIEKINKDETKRIKKELKQKSQNEKDELKSKIEELEFKVEELETELKSMTKKEKKKSKLVNELQLKIDEFEKKRKSDSFEELSNKKSKKDEIFEDESFNFDKENELTSFSPIVLSQGNIIPPSSPIKKTSIKNNHFRIPMSVNDDDDCSPKKLNRKVLKEVNFEVQTKKQLKSPSKSPKKKKIRSQIVLEDEDDLF